MGIHISIGAKIYLNMEWNSELPERELVSKELMSHSLRPDRLTSWSWTVVVHSGRTGGGCASKSELFKLISQLLLTRIIRIFFLRLRVWEIPDKMYCSLKFILIVIFLNCQHSSLNASFDDLDARKYALAVGLFIPLFWLTFPQFQGVRLNKLLIPHKWDFLERFRV